MLTISDCMTPHPFTVGHDIKLSVAHEMMRKHRVRHLPVLDAGRLVGVLSQRDLYYRETFTDAKVGDVAVEEAMTIDPYAVEATAPLADVAREMIRRRLGSALVVEHGKVVGIFTALDGLRALAASEGNGAARPLAESAPLET